MATYTDLIDLFEDIGGAINYKGVTGRHYPNQMADAIRAIPTPSGTLTITENGLYDVADYANADINISSAGGAAATFIVEDDDPAGGKIMYITGIDLSQDTVDAAHLVSGYTAHDSTGEAIVGTYNGIILNNQTNKNVTPSTSQQIISPDSGYTGLDQVTVAAIPSQFKNTSDADAVAANLLYGKIAYNSTGKITGSMPNNGATGGTITTQGGTYTIPAGYTTGGTVTANLSASTLTNSIINGQAALEDTNDYAFNVSVNIPAGYHSATTLTKNFSSILPAPDTEGTSGQVLAGYDLYNHNGQIISGSMTNNGAWNRTLDQTTTSVTIPAGYHNGTGTISHTTVSVPNPTINVDTTTGVITASGSWTRGFTTNNSYSNTSSLSTQIGTTINPTESEQTAVAANKYTLGAVKVGAISTTYVGSGIARKDSTNLTASGATVTVPAGYYSNQATKSVATGSATGPSSVSGTSASLSTGTNTITLTKTGVSTTPTVSAGYVSSATASTATVSLTANVTVKGATTYTPGTTNQTISSGTYLTGTQTVLGDANLVAGNIKDGVTIFGVTGTHVGGSTINNQNKTVTPSESQQTVSADTGYTGLGTVTVNAISSTYVGSGISQRTSSDITFSKSSGDAYYTIPAGYYSSNATKYLTVVNHPQPSVSINSSTGLITATHAQSEGYVYSTNTQTDTLQLTTKGTTTYTPGTSNQTIASGTYLTGTQTISGDSNLVSSNIISGVSIFGVSGGVVINKYYTGSSAPSSSLGNNGDIYFQS